MLWLVLGLWLGLGMAQECAMPCLGSGQCLQDKLECVGDQLIQKDAGACGCCPACVTPLGEGHDCDPDSGPPCPKNFTCLYNATSEAFKCIKAVCPQTGHQNWIPDCKDDGAFRAVQCKGEVAGGRCFCWGLDGRRLPGQKPWAQEDDMTCECSRRWWSLVNSGDQPDPAPGLHCSPDGSFEALQCSRRSGICWCAESDTGRPRGRAVPVGMMEILPCYDEDKMAGGYWRRCDSQAAASAEIAELMLSRGVKPYGLPDDPCDQDGGFAPVQKDPTRVFCAKKDRTDIKSFFTDTSTAKEHDVTCACARDVDSLVGRDEMCQPWGSYVEEVGEQGKEECVDADGFVTGPKTSYKCQQYYSPL